MIDAVRGRSAHAGWQVGANDTDRKRRRCSLSESRCCRFRAQPERPKQRVCSMVSSLNTGRTIRRTRTPSRLLELQSKRAVQSRHRPVAYRLSGSGPHVSGRLNVRRHQPVGARFRRTRGGVGRLIACRFGSRAFYENTFGVSFRLQHFDHSRPEISYPLHFACAATRQAIYRNKERVFTDSKDYH
jgi:hypothetical protein